MAYKKITELPEASSAVDSDLFVIETSGGTRKIQKQSLDFKTIVDPTPTQGSTNAVASGGVYDALVNKMDKMTVDPGPIEDSPNLVTSGGVFQAMELVDRNIIVDGKLLAGQNSLTLTDDHFGEDGLLFNVFADKAEVNVTSMSCNKQNKTLTLIFGKTYNTDTNIVVCLENANYPNYEGTGF